MIRRLIKRSASGFEVLKTGRQPNDGIAGLPNSGGASEFFERSRIALVKSRSIQKLAATFLRHSVDGDAADLRRGVGLDHRDSHTVTKGRQDADKKVARYVLEVVVHNRSHPRS